MKHLAVFFDDSICGLKAVDKRELTYTLSHVTCAACLEASRLEAIECQKALDTLPHCPYCDDIVETVTVTYQITKKFSLDVQTERDWESKSVKPLIYGSEADTLDVEMVYDKAWQVCCANGHEWFTKRIEPIENGEQWFVKEGEADNWGDSPDKERICPVCGNDRSEHNWEVHTAEMKAGY